MIGQDKVNQLAYRLEEIAVKLRNGGFTTGYGYLSNGAYLAILRIIARDIGESGIQILLRDFDLPKQDEKTTQPVAQEIGKQVGDAGMIPLQSAMPFHNDLSRDE